MLKILEQEINQDLFESNKKLETAKKGTSFKALEPDVIKQILSFLTVHQIPGERRYWVICKSIKDFDTTRYLYEKMIGGNEKYTNKDDIAFIRHLWKENPITIDQIKFFHRLMEKDPTVFKGKLENGGEKDTFDTTFQFLMNELNPDFEPSLTGIKNIDYLIKERATAIVYIWEYIFNLQEKRNTIIDPLSLAVIALWKAFPNSFNRILSKFGDSQKYIKMMPFVLVKFLKVLLNSRDSSKNTTHQEKVDQVIARTFFAYQILVEKEENNTKKLKNYIKEEFFNNKKLEFTPLLSLSLVVLPRVKSLYLDDQFMRLFVTNFYNEVTDQPDEKTAKKCEEIFEMCSDTLKQDPSFIKTLYSPLNGPKFLLKHLNEEDKKYIENWADEEDWTDENIETQMKIISDKEIYGYMENPNALQKCNDKKIAIKMVQYSEGYYFFLSSHMKNDDEVISAIASSKEKQGTLFCESEFYNKDKEFREKIFLKYIENLNVERLFEREFYFPDTISLDEELIDNALKISPSIFCLLSPAARSQEGIAYKALKADPKNIWYTKSLAENTKFMTKFFSVKNSEIAEMIIKFPHHLKIVPSWMKEDKEIAYLLVRKDPSKYDLISEEFKKDETFLCAPGVLKFASPFILDDKELMLKVVELDSSKYKFISERLQKDEDILKFTKKE